jgi:hypothetical protein
MNERIKFSANACSVGVVVNDCKKTSQTFAYLFWGTTTIRRNEATNSKIVLGFEPFGKVIA